MEIKKEKKGKNLFKKVGALSLACVFAVGVALTIAFSIPRGEEVSTENVITFGLPMNNAVVVKDYADDKLQFNESLNRWEIHLSVDLTSEDNLVLAACDGVLTSVDENSLEGYVVEIEHADGFVSVYSSLSENVKVAEGDVVSKGQQIGEASDSAANESATGGHLHFTLFKDGLEVDPNLYLDLQNK